MMASKRRRRRKSYTKKRPKYLLGLLVVDSKRQLCTLIPSGANVQMSIERLIPLAFCFPSIFYAEHTHTILTLYYKVIQHSQARLWCQIAIPLPVLTWKEGTKRPVEPSLSRTAKSRQQSLLYIQPRKPPLHSPQQCFKIIKKCLTSIYWSEASEVAEQPSYGGLSKVEKRDFFGDFQPM